MLAIVVCLIYSNNEHTYIYTYMCTYVCMNVNNLIIFLN